ncbi:MAG: 2-succinyl-5-enolpyruvyl-6-hydroxy-3-cyclohexene-1-carboxylic-acid synthase [Ornithinimicrobium sp.]
MHPSTALATVLIDECVRCGVREVVLCPGSRSAPLAYAALEAERAGRLRLHVRVDERSAGFLALGLAKVSRTPALVITTSGTAVANLHPAVLEASHACVPLIVMSADRPSELRGTGANQTTTQPGIFAGAVRYEHDQPPAEGRSGEPASWRSVVCRAYSAAVGRTGDPGPVHLNVALRDPLAPDLSGSLDWPESLEGRAGGMPWVTWSHVPSNQYAPSTGHSRSGTEPEQEQAASRHTRTLVVLGDLPDPAMAEQALDVAHRQHWPVIAEPFGDRGLGGHREVLPHGPLLLSDETFMAEHRPSRVLVVGRHTLHREVAALTRTGGIDVEHVSATAQWSDPSHVVSRVLTWDEFMASSSASGDPDWALAWATAGDAVAERVAAEGLVAEVAGVSVGALVLSELTAQDTLVLGSSNTPRDLNLADPAAPDRPLVVGNRGLAGIDGTNASAVGIALAATQGRVVALMGDLTFEHDINGLLIGANEPVPDLTIVVVNDQGGGIFATLEYGHPQRAADFSRIFATPTGANLAALCAGMKVAHVLVDTLADLRVALAEQASGIRVIEVPIDPATDTAARERLRRPR